MTRDAGKFNTLVAIEELRLAPDGGGGHVKEWAKVADVWAEWRHMSMREKLAAMQIQSSAKHRLYVRYNEFITPTHRVVFRGRAYNIIGVVNVGELNEELEIQLEDGVAI